MTGILLSIFGFIAMIGLLIFIHEFGHFIVAKMFGVRVEMFSIGFVGSIASFKWGETTYKIGWLPLGGYVRMFGELDGSRIPPELQSRSFAHKPLWQRSLVVLAGPLANIIVLPILALMAIFLVKSHDLSTEIGTIIPGRPAQKAGLKPGDRIIAVDGTSTRYFRDLIATVGRSPGRKVTLTIKRGVKTFKVPITPDTHKQKDFLGTERTRGLIGVIAAHRRPEVGISDPQSPAYKAGLRTWDLITAIDGKPITRWEQLARARAEHPQKKRVYTYRRALIYAGPAMQHKVLLPPKTATVVPTKDPTSGAYTDGIRSSELFVKSVRPGTILHQIGLKPGDRLISLGGQKLRVQTDFSSVPRQKTTRYKFVYERAGKVIKTSFLLKPITWVDPLNQRHQRLILGAQLSEPYAAGVNVPIKHRFRYALFRSVERTVEITDMIFRGIGKLFTREIPTDTIGGPIMIFQIAKKAVKSGWETFLHNMVVISINLGLLNLLPIPILDGGHLMFFLIEGAIRKPIPMRVKNAFLLVGFVLLMLLMFIAFRNDLRRFLMP